MLQHIVLGSSSARRQAILKDFRVPFISVSPDFDERQVAFCGDPENYTKHLASKKAYAVSEQFADPQAYILAADTVVIYQNRLFNKPKDEEEAIEMLKTLRNQTHSVMTSLVLLHNGTVFQGTETSQVVFTSIPDEHLKTYLNIVGGLNKCGAYDIAHGGGLLVKEIRGCAYNIQGLPIQTLKHLLLQVNIDLWNFVV